MMWLAAATFVHVGNIFRDTAITVFATVTVLRSWTKIQTAILYIMRHFGKGLRLALCNTLMEKKDTSTCF